MSLDELVENVNQNPSAFLDYLISLDRTILTEREETIGATLGKIIELSNFPEIKDQYATILNRIYPYLEKTHTTLIEKLINYMISSNDYDERLIGFIRKTAWFWRYSQLPTIKRIIKTIQESSEKGVKIGLIKILSVFLAVNPSLSYESLDILIPYVDDPDPEMRKNVVAALRRIGESSEIYGRKVAEKFLDLLEKERDENVLLEVIKSLWTITISEIRLLERKKESPSELISKKLAELLKNAKGEVRCAIIKALCTRTYEDKRGTITRNIIVPALIDGIKNSTEDELQTIIPIVSEIDWRKSGKLWPMVSTILNIKSQNEDLQIARIGGVIKMASYDANILWFSIQQLFSDYPNLRTRAKEALIDALIKYGLYEPKIVSAFIEIIKDSLVKERYSVQMKALDYIKEFGLRNPELFNKILTPVLELAKNSRISMIRDKALSVLITLAQRNKPLLKYAVEAVISELEKDEPNLSTALSIFPYIGELEETRQIVLLLAKHLGGELQMKALRGLDIISAHAPEKLAGILGYLVELFAKTQRRETILELALIFRNTINLLVETLKKMKGTISPETAKRFKENLETVSFEGIEKIRETVIGILQ